MQKFLAIWRLALISLAGLLFAGQIQAATLSISSVPVGTVVKSGDLKFVKVNDNNLLVSLQSLTSVSGESPLTLNDSAGLNLSTYQIDGQTEQNSVLPNGYTQVEYLQSSGTQYIDTGLKVSSDMKFEIDFNTLSATNVPYIWGSRNQSSYSGGKNFSITNVGHPNVGLYCRSTASTSATNILGAIVLGSNNIKYNGDNSVTYNGVTSTADPQYSGVFQSEYNSYLFSINFAGTPSFTSNNNMQLKRYRVWDNTDVLIQDMIPAIRTADSTAGMYDLVNNIFYTNAGSGTFTTGPTIATPTPDVPWEIENLGKKTKNLFDLSLAENGSISLATGANAPVANRVRSGFTYLEAGTYITSIDLPITISNIVHAYSEPNTNSWIGTLTSNNLGTEGNRQTRQLTIETACYVRFMLLPESTSSITDFTVDMLPEYKPQVELGTTPTDYIPNYSVEIISNGKNLLPFYGNFNTVSGGYTHTVTSDRMSFNGSPTGSSYFKITNGYANLNSGPSALTAWATGPTFLPVGTYTFSLQNITGSTNSTNVNYPALGVYYTDGTTGIYRRIDINNNVTFTNSKPIANLAIRLGGISENITYDNWSFQLQIEKGSTTTAYEPYQEPHSYVITLDAPLRCVGSDAVKVCDYIDFKNQRVVRNVGVKVFDGTESWGISDSGNMLRAVMPWNDSHTIIGISSHFRLSTNQGQSLPTEGEFNINGSYVRINIFNIATSINEWTTWLAAQYAAGTPVTVQYQLATPTTESLSLPKVETIAGSSSLWATDGNLQSNNMQVHYWKE